MSSMLILHSNQIYLVSNLARSFITYTNNVFLYFKIYSIFRKFKITHIFLRFNSYKVLYKILNFLFFLFFIYLNSYLNITLPTI